MFHLPEIKYFQFKNCFAGSHGEFNYKVIPDGDLLAVFLWYGPYCLEKSEIAKQRSFPVTAEGLAEAESWIMEEFEKGKS